MVGEQAWSVRGHLGGVDASLFTDPSDAVASKRSQPDMAPAARVSTAAGSPDSHREQAAAPSSKAASAIVWPRFQTRRLLGCATGERGVGGSYTLYESGEHLGRGTFAQVHKCVVGGRSLAVKVFKSSQHTCALQEASIAEHVAHHPHLVCLLDAVQNPKTGASYLVYGHGGVPLTSRCRSEDSSSVVPRLARHVLKGMEHLHGLGLYHSDVKPPNILVETLPECGGLWARLADLGGVIEVGLTGLVRIAKPRTTIWFRAPELLQGEKEALSQQWLRADIWAIGLTLCEDLGLDIHRLKYSSSASDGDVARQMLERLQPFKGVYPWPQSVLKKIGSTGVDFLDSLLSWMPMSRPSAHQCLEHAWLQEEGTLAGLGRSSPASIFPGGRHDWTMLQGTMSQDVLNWLQEECSELQQWKLASHDRQEGEVKYVLSGKMVEDVCSKALNALPISQLLPAPRLRAWLRAFKAKNASSLAKLCASACTSLLGLGIDSIGRNGKHFLTTPMDQWFATAGQLHIFDRPGELKEPRHFDGGASVLHIGITLYGRRHLLFFEGKDKEGRLMETMCLGPGSVYFGTVTGGMHSVAHQPPRLQHEVLDEHSITVMIRTTLFPGVGARRMKRLPLPAPMFAALASSFVASLSKEPFLLPRLEECMSA